MIQDKTRFISYICPSCKQTVVVERDLFSLAAAPAKIPCPCGKSTLRVEFINDKVKVEVPCLFCKEDHVVSCSSEAFMNEKALAFSCSASGLACCYVGEEGPVYAATARLEQAVDKFLEGGNQDQGAFLNQLVMEEVLEELKEIAQRDGISCSCGKKSWEMKVNYSSVDFLCTSCGGQLRIPAATADDIEDICCQYTIQIHGRPRGDLG